MFLTGAGVLDHDWDVSRKVHGARVSRFFQYPSTCIQQIVSFFPFSPDCKQDETNELNVVTYYSQYFYFQKTLESIQSDNGLMLTIVVEETYIQ